MRPTLEAQLSRVVGRENVLTSRLDLEVFGYDAGPVEGSPDLVVLPRTRDELTAVLHICHRSGVPVVPRGAGTCLSGGPVPIQGGVVVVLTRMNRILMLDPESRVAVVEPGVTNLALQRAAAPWGLAFPPDPASFSVSTLGGNAAENAGGPRAIKYGVTSRYVLGLEFILSDGTVGVTGQTSPLPCADLPRPILELASPLVGSEGTLALVSRLTLGLVPDRGATATQIAFFPTVRSGGRAVSALVEAGLTFSALEVMGSLDVRLADEALKLGLPGGVELMLLVEVEGPGPSLDRQIEQAESIVRAGGAIDVRSATDSQEREALWRARRASSGSYGRLKPTFLSLDVTVPRRHVADMLETVEAVAAESSLPIAVVGHAGDGNLHPAVLLDNRRPEEVSEAHRIARRLLQDALRFGGTLSGEHGIGVEKLDLMTEAFTPATLRLFADIKHAFDPAGTLNPGKAVPEVGEKATRKHFRLSGPKATETALNRLDGILGPALVSDESGLGRFGLTGARRPDALALPETVERLAETVRLLVEYGIPIWPVGSGGLLGCAFRPFRGGVAVSTVRLDGPRELCLDDQTVTLGAGYRMSEFNDLLNSESGGPGFSYPVDCARTARSTLGGEIATNACGPGRVRYGTTRDQVLGLTFVTATGDICRLGGHNAKDVSGYDVTRLLCGSWGTLGILAKATMRLSRRAESERTLSIPSACPESLRDAALAIMAKVDPERLQLVSPPGGRGPWRLLVHLAGMAEDVDWWENKLFKAASRYGLQADRLDSRSSLRWWEKARAAAGPAFCRRNCGRDMLWVAGYIRTRPRDLALAAFSLHRAAARAGWRATVTASYPLGVADFGMLRPGDGSRPVEEVISKPGEWLGATAGGRVEVGLYGWTDALDGILESWHPGRAYPPATARLIKRLKDRLDPHSVLAPRACLLPGQ